MLTSEAVIGETCTLLQARRHGDLITPLLDLVEASDALVVEPSDHRLFEESKQLLRARWQHGFSFVDCSSFVLMRRWKITRALTSDAHFRAAGFEPLLA